MIVPRGMRRVTAERQRECAEINPGPVWVSRATAPGLAGAAHGQRIDAQGGLSDPDRNRLALLAAGPHAGIEFQIVADHAHARQHVRTIADEGRPFDR